MLGLMSITAFLSMWISNTATTAMMTPIAQQVIIEVIKFGRSKSVEKGTHSDQVKLLNSHERQKMSIACDDSEKATTVYIRIQ